MKLTPQNYKIDIIGIRLEVSSNDSNHCSIRYNLTKFKFSRYLKLISSMKLFRNIPYYSILLFNYSQSHFLACKIQIGYFIFRTNPQARKKFTENSQFRQPEKQLIQRLRTKVAETAFSRHFSSRRTCSNQSDACFRLTAGIKPEIH